MFHCSYFCLFLRTGKWRRNQRIRKKKSISPLRDFHLRLCASELAVPGAESQEQHHAAQPQAAWLLDPFLHKWVSWLFGSLGCCEVENMSLAGPGQMLTLLKGFIRGLFWGVEAMILVNLAT